MWIQLVYIPRIGDVWKAGVMVGKHYETYRTRMEIGVVSRERTGYKEADGVVKKQEG